MVPAFDEIWFVDFEYRVDAGNLPEPVCLVAQEWFSGREVRLWEDELQARPSPPYRIDRRALFISYVATAELVCHLVLGWALPAVVLDLYIEFLPGHQRPLSAGGQGAARGADVLRHSRDRPQRQRRDAPANPAWRVFT
jgi:hypothetical protein